MIKPPFKNKPNQEKEHTNSFISKLFNIPRSLRAIKKPFKKIAIISSHRRNQWEQEAITALAAGLYNVFAPEERPDLEFLSAENSTKYLYNNAIWHIQRNISEYSVVVTLGHLPSVCFREAQRNWKQKLPQVFVGIEDPAGIGLIGADEKPNEYVTGVQRVLPDSFAEQIAFLQQLRGTNLRMVLPYDGNQHPSIDSSTYKEGSIGSEVLAHNGRLLDIPFFGHTDLNNALIPHLEPGTIVCINNDSPVMAHGHELIELANHHRVTLFSTNLTMVRMGAAIGCGNTGGMYGAFAAEKVYQLLVYECSPRDLNIARIQESSEIRFNPETLEKQNIAPTTDMKRLLHARSAYAND